MYKCMSYKKSKLFRQGCTVVDGRVGSDNGIENVLWYFREVSGYPISFNKSVDYI